MKLGVIVGCLHKVGLMASDAAGFWLSLNCKLREFYVLGYPSGTLRKALERMYARTGYRRWLKARVLLTQMEE